ncbi:hypothetical protein [Microvirga splendida]|uniref:Uncharacterized protein n=1 Tax=Microvirga splendida TaxID=2795727 RepID=A0ABS0Y3I7_9HYPH|nr:hypothetical protein [Microvirga splendida]MBJ6126863.1 hypothetical protein [Microvirga splendida]
MNRIRNKSWLALAAMLLLAATTIVLATSQAAAPDPSFRAHAAHLSSFPVGHDDTGPAADRHHESAPLEGADAADMTGGLPCNAACPVGSSSCGPAPFASHAGSFAQREAGTLCIRPRDDLMLSGLHPDAQLRPPKPIA